MDAYEFAVIIGEETGAKLEIAGGIPTWEAFPSPRHQNHSFRIQSSIRPTDAYITDCNCVHLADIYVRFPDGSLKRPDIALFCEEPAEDEQDGAVTLLPAAVIEILRKGYEDKDLRVGVPFYLAQGIRDVVVLDPASSAVTHFRPGHAPAVHASPALLRFSCGCEATA